MNRSDESPTVRAIPLRAGRSAPWGGPHVPDMPPSAPELEPTSVPTRGRDRVASLRDPGRLRSIARVVAVALAIASFVGLVAVARASELRSMPPPGTADPWSSSVDEAPVPELESTLAFFPIEEPPAAPVSHAAASSGRTASSTGASLRRE